VHAGQATLGPGELDSGDDLFLGPVAAQLNVGGFPGSRLGELGDARPERVERRLERIEPQAVDARAGANGQRPDLGGP
jgi:hypothetical protein